MSGVGCGWSTAMVMACSLVAMIIVVSASRARASGVFSAFSRPEPAQIGRLLRLGLPIGLALFVEVAFFSAATLLIGRLGVDTVAAHQLAAGLLLLGALFQVVDGPQATVMGTLRGYKDTRAPMVIALVAYWLFGLPVGAVLCFGLWSIPGIGVHGMWWGLMVGLVVVASALFARLARVSGDPVRVAQLRLR